MYNVLQRILAAHIETIALSPHGAASHKARILEKAATELALAIDNGTTNKLSAQTTKIVKAFNK